MKQTIIFGVLLTTLSLIAGTVLGKTVTLSWDASPSQVSGYKIYYKVGSSELPLDGSGAVQGPSPLTVGDVLTYTLTGLADDQGYFFAVTAYDKAGYESSFSNMVDSPPLGGWQPPVLTAIGAKSIVAGAILSFTLSASDPDGDSLTYSASNLPSGAQFNSATHVFSWTPGVSQAGTYSAVFTVSDGLHPVSETVPITVVAGNQAPVLAAIGTKSVPEGSPISFTISATDPDGDALSYSASNLPSGASFNPATRSFSWIPSYDSGTNTRVYALTFAVTDGSLIDEEMVTINVTNVNRAPVLEPIGPQAVLEGDSFNLIVDGIDPDGESLSFSASNLPTGAVFIPSTRSLSWIPDTTQAGTYSVTISVSDGSLSDSETFNIQVSNLNQAPQLNPIGNQTASENSLLSFTLGGSDPDGDTLSYSAANLPAGASFDPQQHRFIWIPAFNQAGTFSVTFTVSDGQLSDAETLLITVSNTNQQPQISGIPNPSIMARTSYSFVPTATDLDGDVLTFNISNKPSWATFDPATGELTGTPDDQQVGTTGAIIIGVTDGTDSAVLPSFTITVTTYTAADSDGDGVLDNVDAFPNDPSEWADTDGDGTGNNSDSDDDNDGIADVRDGFPFDAARSGWVISASAGLGGYVTPEGDTEILYGGSQEYLISAKAGYYPSGVLVDQQSVGIVDHYLFSNVSDHHSLQAVFKAIPNGLSLSPVEPGLPGVARVDGGDDAGNLVNGTPKLDLKYRFGVTLRDSVALSQRKVFLIIDGYRYPMNYSSGTLASGAIFSCSMPLGPAATHSFYFIAEDPGGLQLYRYPQAGSLAGPVVELLQGETLIGVAGDINQRALDSASAFNVSQAYRWLPGENLSGEYQLVSAGAPVKSGEGYVIKRTTASLLPQLNNYPEIAESSYTLNVSPGWNLISNPYRGNLPLTSVQVIEGTNPAVSWQTAASNSLLVDAVYSYQGQDWGNVNSLASAGGTEPAILVPWIGYWIYINPTEQSIKLLFPKPLQ